LGNKTKILTRRYFFFLPADTWETVMDARAQSSNPAAPGAQGIAFRHYLY
tara:strand:- start:455 stop:604 length:150 start_codon:yes stop_codon:yes gene_type:complete